jgi:hypothetical protein
MFFLTICVSITAAEKSVVRNVPGIGMIRDIFNVPDSDFPARPDSCAATERQVEFIRKEIESLTIQANAARSPSARDFWNHAIELGRQRLALEEQDLERCRAANVGR